MAHARYKRLVDHFAAQIQQGHWPPGTRLPTHRQLAAKEGIALVTASRVYAELERMGLVSGEAGRGTFVRETALPASHGIDQSTVSEGMVDLNFNSPSLPGQTQLLRQALRDLAGSGDLEALLHYQPHAGRPHERATVAQYLQARGLACEAGNVLLVSGAQHGLATAVMALLKPGDVVACDALTYPGFKVLAQVHRLELAPIPILPDGPDLDALARLCQHRRVKAIYTMPTLHNPMGWVLPLAQRQVVADLARHHDLLVIEDAAYAFHAASAPSPLVCLAPERTVYVSGFSKNIATGLRVGFVVAPSPWVPLLERYIRASTWNTPSLMTHMVCRWIKDGIISQLEADKRRDAQVRQQLVRDLFHDVPTIAHPCAYFTWLPLPDEVRADQVVMSLMQSRIAVSTAEPYSITEHTPHALRLALGSVDIDTLKAALQTIRQVVDEHWRR